MSSVSEVKSPDAYKTISEVADTLKIQPHVLRFWESKFSQIKPMKRRGGRRYYSPKDVDLLNRIHRLLYNEGYTIKGVQKLLKRKGVPDVLSPSIVEQDNTPPQTLQIAPEKAPVAASDTLGFEELLRHELKVVIKELTELRNALKKAA